MVLFVFCSRKISVLNVILNAPQNFSFWLMTSVLVNDILGRAVSDSFQRFWYFSVVVHCYIYHFTSEEEKNLSHNLPSVDPF